MIIPIRHRKQDHVSKMNVSKMAQNRLFVISTGTFGAIAAQPRLICVFRIRLSFEMIILTVILATRS